MRALSRPIRTSNVFSHKRDSIKMCNGFSTRSSLGGAVVRVHPIPTSLPSTRPFSCLLQFHNTKDNFTTLSYRFDQNSSNAGSCDLRIHKLGDLTSGVMTAGQVLHSVPLFGSSKTPLPQKSGAIELDRRLDLDIGGEGIIGRTVSVVSDAGELLGEGVVGWN